jgi:hypothetical protein
MDQFERRTHSRSGEFQRSQMSKWWADKTSTELFSLYDLYLFSIVHEHITHAATFEELETAEVFKFAGVSPKRLAMWRALVTDPTQTRPIYVCLAYVDAFERATGVLYKDAVIMVEKSWARPDELTQKGADRCLRMYGWQ